MSAKSRVKTLGIQLATVVFVGGLGALAPVLSGWLTPRVYFNFGPGDHEYLEGFEPRWEIDPDGLATHWSSYQSAVRLPLRLKGGRWDLTYRFSRVYGQTAQIDLRVNGVPADQFAVRGGAYYERSAEIPGSVLESRPFEMSLRADSHERANRGLRMDWLRLEAQDSRGRVVPAGSILFWSAVLSLAFWALASLSVQSRRLAFGLGMTLPLALGLFGTLAGPFPLVHVIRSLSISGLGVIGLGMLFVPWARRRGAALIPGITVTAFLVRAGALFHPLYYHPDLRSHADLAEILSRVGLDFWARPLHYIAEQGVWVQGAMGQSYAFPFSPVFHALFLPFDLDFFATMDAMKLLACLVSALEVPIVFYLGRRLGGAETGIWAGALAAFTPAAFSRLSYAFLAAVFAHFLDTLVLASLASRAEAGKWRLVVAVLLLTLALGSYAGSLVNFGLFFPLFGLLLLLGPGRELRRDGWILLTVSAGAALLVMSVVYREFVAVFLTELLPRFLSGESQAGSVSLWETARTLVRRLWIFFDTVYIPLVLLGAVVWVRRRPDSYLLRLVGAWALTFLALIFLRVAAPDLFNKTKEILWIAPLVSLAGGEALAWLRRSFLAGAWIAGAYYALVVYYGLSFYVASISEKFALAR